VHDDAELAVVRVSFIGVQVGDLSYRKQGQKDKAQAGNGRQESAAAAALSQCLESCQSIVPAASILQKRT
jgi:hypothetical protein